MSRGLGRIEKRCLEVLEEQDARTDQKAMGTTTIAANVYGVEKLTAAQHASIRRALGGLAKKGHVSRTGRWHLDYSEHWILTQKPWKKPPAEKEKKGSSADSEG